MKQERSAATDNGLDQRRRNAILDAARQVFGERGYHQATTLEIASRARTSKRALYELFGSKGGIVRAMITERVRNMRHPFNMQPPASRDEFFTILKRFGVTFMTELMAPPTVAMYRLAIAESAHSGELGAALYEAGRLAITHAVRGLFAEAVARKWVEFVDVHDALGAYMYTLMGDVLMRLLLGAEKAPGRSELRKRAELAVDVVHQFDRAHSMRD
jgi:AcrR family transcriptional regulator